MKFEVKSGMLKEFLKSYDKEYIRDVLRWSDDDRIVEINSDRLSEEELDKLYFLSQDQRSKYYHKPLVRKIGTYLKLRANPEGAQIGRLQNFEEAAKKYIGKSPNKWLFVERGDGIASPYFVHRIEYHPFDARSQDPAHTVVSMASIDSGEKNDKTLSVYQSDLGNKPTVVQFLNDRGFFLETESSVKAYYEDMERYAEVSAQTGKQYNATGYGFISGSRWHSGTATFDRDGAPTKVLIDDRYNEEEGRKKVKKDRAVSSILWSAKQKTISDEDSTDTSVRLPIHPYINCFDLQKHEYVSIHVSNLTPYVYDNQLADKLVLPQEHKDLVQVLIQSANKTKFDIIEGKSSGVIVIATGPPGTGKTLTAEVMAEAMEFPLYIVQCSQLGTDEESLERKLNLVLNRATRWNALLLIDEADVYIHERGNDINQNAIVGVFLRLLEYYKGILFMTSNRAGVIDDAIMSRATAWIKYEMPNPELLKRIWQIHASQHETSLKPKDLDALVHEFPSISGRNVRSLLKLAVLLVSGTDKPVDFRTLCYVSQFQKLSFQTSDD